MSQDELAEKLNVTRQSISLWETGQTQPSLDNIVALAKLFNISTDDLLTGESTESADTETLPVAPQNRNKKKVYIIIIIGLVIAALLMVAFLFKNKTVPSGGETSSIPVQTEESSPSEEPSEESEEPSAESYEEVSKEPVKAQSVSKPAEKPATPPATNKSENVAPKEPEKETPKPAAKKPLFDYLKDFVIQKGTLNGDYCYYSKPANNYGGYSSEDFSLYYWGDTDKIEFCLHSVMDDTFSVNFYLYVPKNHTGNYEYISSYYYRDNGESLYEAKGTINAGSFTRNYPLNCSRYIGSTDKQNDFMEMSRQGICDLIDCLKNFIKVENLEYSFSDFGFTAF